MLVITNPEGTVLEIAKGQPTGHKRTKTGNIEQFDLSHPYLQGLIASAQIVIEHRKKTEEKKQEEIP